MELSFSDDLDVNLESTVLLTLSRLQKMSKQRSTGVSCKKVVEFLKANYSWVDGDVESQVVTALLSCIKTGFVCALNNRKYLLLGANPSNMSSHCVTRVFHGPKCCCLSMFKFSLRGSPRTCCVINKGDSSVKKVGKGPRRKSRPKPKVLQSSRRNRRKNSGKKQESCAEKARNQIGTSQSNISLGLKEDPKCNYCFEVHSLNKLKSMCMTCYPMRKFNMRAPPDKFSPRDEITAPLTENL